MTNLTNPVNTLKAAAVAISHLNLNRAITGADVDAAYAAFNSAGRPASYIPHLNYLSTISCQATLAWCRAAKVVR